MGWAAIRPVAVGLLLIVDAVCVAVLALVHPRGWVPPLIAFGALQVGLVWFEVWCVRHRHDDE